MKRDMAITHMRIAGYHDDNKQFTRLLIENRVNREVADKAWHTGQKQKAGGMPCHCHLCKAAGQ